MSAYVIVEFTVKDPGVYARNTHLLLGRRPTSMEVR